MPRKNGKPIHTRWVCHVDDFTSTVTGETAIIMDTRPYVFSRDWMDDGLGRILLDLKLYGCCPSICLNGKKWRFYINTGTSMYDESDDLRAAFRKAFRKWQKAGQPNASERTVELYVREFREGGNTRKCLQWRIV